MKCGFLTSQRPKYSDWNCVDHKVYRIRYHSPSAARNAPVLLRGFVVVFFPLLRPFEVPRVELEPRENEAFRLKPRPLEDPVETQGSGQSSQG